MIEAIRAYAREVLPSGGMPVSRETYISWVRSYAVDKHGNKPDVVMHAERTARYLWEKRR